MKNILPIACILLFSASISAFGQQISETNLSLGISKTTAPNYEQHWDEEPPTHLLLNASKSLYNNDHVLSLRKEAGLNLQYSNIHNSTGGLGASNEYTGNVISLFAQASLQARIRINSSLAFGLGPEAEVLLIGYNNIDLTYYSMLYYPKTTSGSKRTVAINSDYFNQPSYGIKACLFESGATERATLGLAVSYLWTKAEDSNFYASNYTRISFFIGFRNQKNVSNSPEDQVIQARTPRQ